MSISFSLIPSTLRVPIVAAEFDNSRAAQGPALLPFRALLVGQKLPSAPQAANTLVKVTNSVQVANLCGRGSQLHRMARAWYASNQSTELYLLVLDDATSATLATGTLTVTGPATAAGTIYLYVGNQRYTVAVASGDSASTIAGNIATTLGKHASGTVTMNGVVATTDVVTIAGVGFVPVNGAVVLGAATFDMSGGNNGAASSLAAQVNAHATARQSVRASAASAVTTLRAVAGGTGGNAITIAAVTPAHTALSGATLAGATTDTDLPVHASVSGAVVTLNAMNAGAVANECDVRLNYNDGEALPAGVGVAIVAMSGGATNPTLTTGITAMGDTRFDVIGSAYTDATSLLAMETELARRLGPMVAADGFMITAKNDTYGNVGTLGQSRNSPQAAILRTANSPTPPEEYAASAAAVAAFYAAIDPARPFQTLPLDWVGAPALSDRDTKTQRDLLLHQGISTAIVDSGGVVRIERLISTYQTNAAGAADTSYLDATTMFTLFYFRYAWRVRMSKFARFKVADDGTRFGAGQAIITPKIGRGEAVAFFEEMEELGLVEDVDQFKNDLIVERHAGDPGRLDFLLPPNLINGLGPIGTKIQFLL